MERVRDSPVLHGGVPTGIVAFLFTDIEGSTRRWEARRLAMQSALRRHDAIMSEAIAYSNGYAFKTVGDAFCVAFSTVPDAVRAALAAQRALLKDDWSAVDGLNVRMAIHAGGADERDGDYFGPTTNRVARLLATAHGGQVLLSGAAADLAQGDMPSQTTLRDLGRHRLKDLTYPEQVYQLVADDLQAEFSPLRSLDALPNNLPLQLTTLIGRENDVAQIKNLLGKARLLTLVGTGGVGKTRLALHAAAELLDEFPDGVWFIELARVSNPDSVADAVASELHLSEEASQSVIDGLLAGLKYKRTLLIFDNCEHVVSAAAAVVESILHACPNVKVMATSREGLSVSGEEVLRVASLMVPDATEKPNARDASRYGAVALFLARATAVEKTFALTDENSSGVTDICRTLDGIPLAIELAAVRIQALSVHQLSARLKERFRILTGGSRTALPRHQTMRALIDWSYDLLTSTEKTVLRRVAVFAGTFTLEAASEICSDQQIKTWDVLELLSSLISKSLVAAELCGSQQQYRLLESTRQYAAEKLAESGEDDRLHRRHAEHFLSIAERANEAWDNPPMREWYASLERDLDNLRAAMDWGAQDRGTKPLGAALVGALLHFWEDGQLFSEGVQRARSALQTVDVRTDRAIVARLWLTEATLLPHAQRFARSVKPDASPEAATTALELYTSLQSPEGIACCLRARGTLHYVRRQYEESRTDLVEAANMFRSHDHLRMLGRTLHSLARTLLLSGRAEESRPIYLEALEITRSQGDDSGTSEILSNLAESEFQLGTVHRALLFAQESLELIRGNNLPKSLTFQLCNMASYLIELGKFDEARSAALEALRYARQSGQFPIQIATSLLYLALIHSKTADPRCAARLAGYVEGVYKRHEWVPEYTERHQLDKLLAFQHSQLSNAELNAVMMQGAALGEEQAIEEAITLAGGPIHQ